MNYIYVNFIIFCFVLTMSALSSFNVFSDNRAGGHESVSVYELCEKGTIELYLAMERGISLSDEEFKQFLGHDKHKAIAVSQQWELIQAALDKYGADSDVAIEMLISAASAGHVDIVKNMITHGVSPDGRDDNVPLLAAASCGRAAALEELIYLGANPNAYVPGQGDAMMSAVLNKNTHIADVLLSAGYANHQNRSTNDRLKIMMDKSDIQIDSYPWSELVQN